MAPPWVRQTFVPWLCLAVLLTAWAQEPVVDVTTSEEAPTMLENVKAAVAEAEAAAEAEVEEAADAEAEAAEVEAAEVESLRMPASPPKAAEAPKAVERVREAAPKPAVERVVAAPKAAEAPKKVVEESSGHDIYKKLEHGKAAGLSDLDLSAVAAKAKRMASEELKQATAGQHDARRLRAAFDNAERAGIPATEQAASKASVVDSAGRRLATALASATSGNATADLANALSHGRSVGLNQSLLESATKEYERLAVDALEKKDLRRAEILVQNAGAAGATVPGRLHEWVKVVMKLRDSNTVAEDLGPMSELSNTVSHAKSLGLPANSDLAAAEKRVQAWSSKRVNAVKTSGSNITEVQFNELLQELEQAKIAGIASNLTTANAQVLSFARSALARISAGQAKSYDGGRLKKAFLDAELAGVPAAEIQEARNKVAAGIDLHLNSLMGSQGNNSNSNTKRSRAFVEEFAQTVTLADRFGSQAHVADARDYFQQQGDVALAEKNLDYAVLLAEHASIVGTTVPPKVSGWASMLQKLKEAKNTPDGDKLVKLPELAAMVQSAKQLGMPNSSDFTHVEQKVQSWAQADLSKTMSKTGNSTSLPVESFRAVLNSLEQAKAAGLSASALRAAEELTTSWASKELTRACSTKPYDAAKLKMAFQAAEQVGIPAATREQKRVELVSSIGNRLSNASSNAARRNGSQELDELEDALRLAGSFAVNEQILEDARSLFQQKGVQALADKDFDQAERVYDASNRAGAGVSVPLRTAVQMLAKLRETEKQVETTEQLPGLVDIINEAKRLGFSGNKHLAAVEAKAKKLAAADLKFEL